MVEEYCEVFRDENKVRKEVYGDKEILRCYAKECRYGNQGKIKWEGDEATLCLSEGLKRNQEQLKNLEELRRKIDVFCPK